MPQIQEKWLRILKGFLVGEVCLQVINAVTGLLLVRWMSVEQFAQYSVANAFQSGAQQFVEFGLGGALVALVGKDVSDCRRMGRLVDAGCHICRKTLLHYSRSPRTQWRRTPLRHRPTRPLQPPSGNLRLHHHRQRPGKCRQRCCPSPHVHKIILVIRSGKTPRKAILRCIMLLKKAQATIGGFVFNRLPTSRISFY